MTQSLTTVEFILKCISVHGSKYDYSEVEYIRGRDKVRIICPKHGLFEQRAENHIVLGHGCPDCGLEKRIIKRQTGKEKFLKIATEIYGDRYDYSLVSYKNNKVPVRIICPVHGEFSKTPVSHIIKKRGCPECNPGFYRKSTTENFVDKAKKIHGDRFNYENSVYTGSFDNIKIQCERHGSFLQIAKDHYRGRGCPKCAGIESKQESELYQWIKKINNNLEIIRNTRSVISPFELDIYIPEKNLAIEYCGLRWHSEILGGKSRMYHRNKMMKCADKGIHLVTIFSDEWLTKTISIQGRLRNILGFSDLGVGARECEIHFVHNKEASDFIDAHHTMGKTRASESVGAYHNGKMVGSMQFGPRSRIPSGIELKRFCTDGKSYPGLMSKMFSFYTRQRPGTKEILTFSDRRWSDGPSYEKLGFYADNILPPDYTYTKDFRRRENKSKYRISNLKKEHPQYLGQSEWDIMRLIGYDRIWDCGKIRYRWQRN